ncbi:MAG TPA: hypothetical protein VK926_04735 [Gaiellaceae bacterium]|nr:hypothetical protein [Gaiellaceae bacterium]
MRALLAAARHGVARAEAAGGAWTVERVLDGVDVRCLAADPLEEGVVWAGTQGDGLYRSDDAGRSWRPSGIAGRVVKSVAPSPTEPGVVYAGAKPALIFTSRDGGTTWSELESFRRIRGRRLWFSPAEKPFTAYVQGLALSPADPRVIVAGIEVGAVVRSEDGGTTWSGHRPGASRDCHSLQFHATDGRFVYEGGGTGPAMSRDAGRAWDGDRSGLDRRYCWAATADPEDPEVWYVSASTGPRAAHGGVAADACVYRRRSARWETVAGPLDDMPYALFHDSGRLHMGLASGRVLRLDDEWSPLPLELGPGTHVFVPVS